MKRIYKAAMLFTLVILFCNTQAQFVAEKRPQLFASYAKSINFPKTELEKIFTATEGKSIKLSLNQNVGFTGIVVSSVKRYKNLQNVIIRLGNLDNTILGISRIINDDKTISFTGRIINTSYSDAFELKTDTNGNYFISKVKTADLIQDRE